LPQRVIVFYFQNDFNAIFKYGIIFTFLWQNCRKIIKTY